MSYPFTRYLAAKKSVDDRALNRQVLADLRRLVPSPSAHVLEIGAGLGTMAARLLEWQVLRSGVYTLLDVDPRLLRDSRTWLCDRIVVKALPMRPPVPTTNSLIPRSEAVPFTCCGAKRS